MAPIEAGRMVPEDVHDTAPAEELTSGEAAHAMHSCQRERKPTKGKGRKKAVSEGRIQADPPARRLGLLALDLMPYLM